MGKNHYTAPTIQVEETDAVLPKVNEPQDDEQEVSAAAPAVSEPDPVVTGKVTDCGQLNVRRAPSMNATVMCTIDRDAEVTVDEGKSTAEWYRVCTAAGVNGFCMKKYITISQ